METINSDEELDAIGEMTVQQLRHYLGTPNRCWSDSYCDCAQQRAADRMLEHYDALARELAEAQKALRSIGWSPDAQGKWAARDTATTDQPEAAAK